MFSTDTPLPMAWEARQGGAKGRSAGVSARTRGTASVPTSASRNPGELRGSWGCSWGLLGEGANRWLKLGATVALLPPCSSLQTSGTCLVAFIPLPRSPGKVSPGCFCCTIVSLLANMKQCYFISPGASKLRKCWVCWWEGSCWQHAGRGVSGGCEASLGCHCLL